MLKVDGANRSAFVEVIVVDLLQIVLSIVLYTVITHTNSTLDQDVTSNIPRGQTPAPFPHFIPGSM
jgi:hypothetical protein